MDVLNVGGFSDAVFEIVAGFVNDEGRNFVDMIEGITI
jgi:hypothetical protein